MLLCIFDSSVVFSYVFMIHHASTRTIFTVLKGWVGVIDPYFTAALIGGAALLPF